MTTGAITQYVDVAQLALYGFWIFFAGLIVYLQREMKREGYPLESDRSAHVKVQGWPAIPSPKTYRLADGRSVTVPGPRRDPQPPLHEGAWRGMPLVPAGDPMTAGVGPGSWAARADVPDRTVDGQPRLAPLRAAPDFGVDRADVDPRGLAVIGADGVVGGEVVDVWVDRAEMLFRYLELRTGSGRQVLLPMNFARIDRRGVRVASVLGAQLDGVPGTASPVVVTMLEEEKVMAYYGAGTLYATPRRQEPWL